MLGEVWVPGRNIFMLRARTASGVRLTFAVSGALLRRMEQPCDPAIPQLLTASDIRQEIQSPTQ